MDPSESDTVTTASVKVGIIFFHDSQLHIDSAPVADAVHYGELLTHEKGHPDFWEELQRRGVVPADVEYDEVPRGRVTYSPKQGKALLLLDRCILGRPDFVKRIREVMHLPDGEATKVSTDSHYVCPGCRPVRQPEDDGW